MLRKTPYDVTLCEIVINFITTYLSMDMPKCMRCGGEGEVELRYARLVLCGKCFTNYFIDRLRKTSEEYKMIRKGDKIGVYYDGSIGSVALADSIARAYPDHEIHIIYVDMGITYYSVDARNPIEELAQKHGLRLHVYSLPKERGYSIEDFRKTKYWRKICSTCGVLKRYYYSYVAYREGVDVLATPHTLDDIVEILFTLFIDGKLDEIPGISPVQEPEFPNQVRRVKPFIKTYEWEVKRYVEILELPTVGYECPLREGARSIWRKEVLQELEAREPAIMRKMLRVFMKKLTPLLSDKASRPELRPCKICGGPSITGVCGKCVREIYLRERKNLDIKIG